MQPAAAEVERKAGRFGDRPGPPAEPRPRLDDEAVEPASRSRRPAAMPAAPPPTITTSKSPFAIVISAILPRRQAQYGTDNDGHTQPASARPYRASSADAFRT